jgi:hypothetical protein
MILEQEITDLTNKWMKYVSLDHHKNRDCNWYITKSYCYGEDPYYEASHNGYILDNWISPKCDTEELASTLLRDKLKKELKLAVVHLEDTLSNSEALDWFGKSKEEIEEIIGEIR